MATERRTLKRKPLSDCTNIISSFNSSLLQAKKPPPTTQKRDDDSSKHDTSTGSNHAENPNSQPYTPPQRKSSDNSGTVDCENSKIVTIYRRKQTLEKRKQKGKAVVVASSCPPARQTRSIEHTINEEHGDVGLSKLCTVPRPKCKQKLRESRHEQGGHKHALPQDFIDQQRAYFAEIDAFELPEEVVSESELE